MIRCLLPLLLLTSPLAAQREFPARVVTDFGGLMDDPAAEINRMSTVVRTARGQFVVANGDPLSVRVYDSSGRILRTLGRFGEGPGEFRYQAIVRPWTGDSVLTMSLGTLRWMLYGLDGKLIREWAVDSTNPDPRGLQMSGATFIRTGTIGRRGCMLTAVGGIPAPTPWRPREAITDQAGRTWLNETGTRWRVYSPAGAQIGTVTLPARFQIQQLSGDLLIGHRYDEDNAEHVTMVQVTLPAAPPAGPPCVIPGPPNSPRVREFKTALRNTMTAGEAYKSDTRSSYPRALDNTMFVGPQNADVAILKATGDTYVVMITDKLSSLRCLVSIGSEGIPAWPSGMLACTN